MASKRSVVPRSFSRGYALVKANLEVGTSLEKSHPKKNTYIYPPPKQRNPLLAVTQLLQTTLDLHRNHHPLTLTWAKQSPSSLLSAQQGIAWYICRTTRGRPVVPSSRPSDHRLEICMNLWNGSGQGVQQTEFDTTDAAGERKVNTDLNTKERLRSRGRAIGPTLE